MTLPQRAREEDMTVLGAAIKNQEEQNIAQYVVPGPLV
jgi:hypothetical protein